ncbi:hypothetical protein Tco_0950835 [Tanacetum coccineum]
MERMCRPIWQDLSLRSVLRTGSQCERLGHPAYLVLNVLKKSLQIYNDKNLCCEVCQRAKQTREPFPLSDHVYSSLGDLVHVDLWGPYKKNTTNEITDLHQNLEEVLLTDRGDSVTGIKRRRRDPSSDGVRDLVMASGRRTIDQSVGGKLRDRNAKESWELLEDLALYDNESWNDPRDFAKPVKAIALPQDVSSTSDRRLIDLENQVQHLMEAHLAPTQPTQVRKVTTLCEICSGPHDTQYCMEDPE